MRRSAFCRRLGQRLELTFRVQQDQVLDTLDQLTPKTVVDRYSNTKRTRRASLGDIRVNQIRQMLETGMGVQRSKMQVRFHEAFLAATSRHLYQSDENVDWARVRQAQGWKDCRSVVLCQVCLVCDQQLCPNTHSQPPRRPRVVLARPGRWDFSSPPTLWWCRRSNPFSPQVSPSF